MLKYIRTETGAFIARRDGESSSAFDFYSQYFKDRADLTALGTIQAPAWVDSPEIRGTSAILWSCILTIIACVYTALHLNIPPKGGFWRLLAIKIRWVIMALLVPEVMIYMSIIQFFEARHLRKNLIKVLQKLRESGKLGRNEGRQLPLESSIDLRLCFFIQMGGIKIKPRFTDIEWWEEYKGHDHHHLSTLLEEQRPEYQLTPDGVHQLLHMGHWFPVASDLISDKSKANNFQKALVLLQVGWFAIQCIARKSYGLPLSLLEIHTVVHVVTAAVMYTFWFEKPLDIREPEIWDDTTAGALEFCTHISLLSSSVKSGLDSIAIHQASGPLNEEDLGTLGYRLENLYTSPILPNGQSKPQNIDLTDEVAKEMTELDTRHLEYIVSYIEEHHAECIRPEQGSRSLKETIEKICGDKYHSAMLQLSSRHNLIVVEDVFDGKLLRHETRTDSWDTINKVIRWLFGVDNGGGIAQFQNYNFLLAILLPAAYGGIHLAAWNAAYPSMVEHIMWRAACITIMTGLPGILASVIIAVLVDELGCSERVEVINIVVMVLIVLAMTVLLISARCFIIVESFISLRSAPIGVYWTPAWIQILPHA